MATITYIKETRQRPSDMQRVMDYCMQEKKTWDEEAGIRFVTGINCDGLNSAMGAHYGGGVGSILDTGLRAMSAFGRMTETEEEDEEERRRRIQADENSRGAGTALGLAIGALLAIRDEEEQRAEAALQEEYENEQQSIWQLSM